MRWKGSGRMKVISFFVIEALSRRLSGGSEESHEKTLSGWDSSQAPPEYECTAIEVRQSSRWGVLLDKLTVAQLMTTFPPFYGTQRYISVFVTAHHWTLSCQKNDVRILRTNFLKTSCNIQIADFWDVTTSISVDNYWCFGLTAIFIFHPEDGDKIFLRTVGNCLWIYKALRPRTH